MWTTAVVELLVSACRTSSYHECSSRRVTKCHYLTRQSLDSTLFGSLLASSSLPLSQLHHQLSSSQHHRHDFAQSSRYTPYQPLHLAISSTSPARQLSRLVAITIHRLSLSLNSPFANASICPRISSSPQMSPRHRLRRCIRHLAPCSPLHSAPHHFTQTPTHHALHSTPLHSLHFPAKPHYKSTRPL